MRGLTPDAAGRRLACFVRRQSRRPRMPSRHLLWLLSGAVGVLVGLVFLWWSIQTAWLGSFPGRDIDVYSRWSIAQFVACLLCFMFAVIAFVKFSRAR
jgi:hypothetical protein